MPNATSEEARVAIFAFVEKWLPAEAQGKDLQWWCDRLADKFNANDIFPSPITGKQIYEYSPSGELWTVFILTDREKVYTALANAEASEDGKADCRRLRATLESIEAPNA